MKTIDDELTRAGNEIRIASQRLPDRAWDQPMVQVWVQPTVRRSPRLAAAVFGMLVVVAAIGLPTLLLRGGDPSSFATSDSGSIVAVPSTPLPSNVEFPHLGLVAEGWHPTLAYDQTNEATGSRTTSVEYAEETEDGSGATIRLTVQTEGHEGGLLAELRAAGATAEEPITMGEQAATLFTYTDHAHALHWIEVSGIEAALIADGLTRKEALALADDLQPIPPEAWLELTLVYPSTPTTIAPSPDSGDWNLVAPDLWVVFVPEGDDAERLWVRTDIQPPIPAPSTDTPWLAVRDGDGDTIIVIVDLPDFPRYDEVPVEWSDGSYSTAEVVWNDELGVGIARLATPPGATLTELDAP